MALPPSRHPFWSCASSHVHIVGCPARVLICRVRRSQCKPGSARPDTVHVQPLANIPPAGTGGINRPGLAPLVAVAPLRLRLCLRSMKPRHAGTGAPSAGDLFQKLHLLWLWPHVRAHHCLRSMQPRLAGTGG